MVSGASRTNPIVSYIMHRNMFPVNAGNDRLAAQVVASVTYDGVVNTASYNFNLEEAINVGRKASLR